MSDELEEELCYTAARRYAELVPLSGRLRGAGRMPADHLEHLGGLWWDERLKPPSQRLPMAAFAAYVYRCARIQEREDLRVEERKRNERLAERIAAGARMPVDEIAHHARQCAVAGLDMPAARAVELADEIERLRGQVAAYADRVTTGGPPPPIDPQWANPDLDPPASASDPAAPTLGGQVPGGLLRCDRCGHMWNRHDPDRIGCHVMVEVNRVSGVATGLEPCGCRERRPA